MQRITASLLATLLAGTMMSGVAADAAPTPKGPYLYDLAKQNSVAWKKALGSRAPLWLKQGGGPSSPASSQTIDGKEYWLANTCKTHNCGNNLVYALFAKTGDSVVALSVSIPDRYSGSVPRRTHAKLTWLGKPDAAQKEVLQKKLAETPDW
ncbi:Ivy family c-type lysozyme inhibitor [Andreprevotia chitinilytica]|uniref:Ivy family c-type lysozyme inhibitor n=1 Tax=Andreprevotia chitinilytica TaxID=396808 RepID=UPI0005590612|nr:Ivy family c-type lysozyme inhibitor [Andreprevotia chitinilytica]